MQELCGSITYKNCENAGRSPVGGRGRTMQNWGTGRTVMVELEERGVITVLRMKAGRGNALSLDLVEAMTDAFDTFAHGPTRAVVLTGEGRVFGAGVDLTALTSG